MATGRCPARRSAATVAASAVASIAAGVVDVDEPDRPASQAEDGAGPVHDVVRLGRGVDARRGGRQSLDGDVDAEPLVGVLARGADPDQVGGGAARHQDPLPRSRELEQLGEPAQRDRLEQVVGLGAAAARAGHGCRQGRGGAGRGRLVDHPAREAGRAEPVAVRHDVLGQHAEHLVETRALLGERLVEGGPPAAPGSAPRGRRRRGRRSARAPAAAPRRRPPGGPCWPRPATVRARAGRVNP